MNTYPGRDRDPADTTQQCAWCGLPPAGHGTRTYRGTLSRLTHTWTTPGTELIRDRARYSRGMPWRSARFEEADGTLVRRLDAPDEVWTPRAPAESNAEATEGRGAYPSDLPGPSELLRRAQDFDPGPGVGCPSRIAHESGAVVRCLVDHLNSPGPLHGNDRVQPPAVWADDDDRVIFDTLNIPLRDALNLSWAEAERVAVEALNDAELLRRARDFDRCPSEIRRHDGRYRCTLGRPHPDPHSAHGVTWTDDDPRVVITGIGLPVREAEPLRTINRDSDRDSDFRPLCLARHNGMICDRQAGHQGAHVDVYGPLDDHIWSDEPGTCPHGYKPTSGHWKRCMPVVELADLTALGVVDRTVVACGECGDGKGLKPGSACCPACGAPPYCCEPGCEEHA